MNDLDIMSTASTKLGKAKIESLDDGSKESEVFGQLWPVVKPACLARYDWNFNKFEMELSREIAAPATSKWTYRFLLPSDYLSGNSFFNESETPVDYAIQNGRVLRNSERVFTNYQRDVDSELFDPLFAQYAIAALAYEAQEPLLGEGAVAARLRQEVADKFEAAKERDAMSRGARPFITTSQVLARRRGGRP